MKKLIALVLVFAMLLSLGILPASAEPIPVSEEKESYVFTEADNALLDGDVFARIGAVKAAAADQKDGVGSLTEQDYINLIPDVIQAVKASETYVPGTLQQNGFFLVWETTVGMPCCYDPHMEAKLHSREYAPSSEELAAAEARAARILELAEEPNGGFPSSVNIGLIQPYWESTSNYADSSFNSYSPSYKAMWQNLNTATGGTGMRYSMANANVNNIAKTIEECAIVILDSHGTTDYSGGYDDYTSRANSSYLCLTTSSGITTQDTAAQQGPYGTFYHAIRTYDGAYVDGTCIANHMTKDAPHSLVYMGICLGMATDGMFSGLRAAGVETVWGYSQSVSFYGEEIYMKSILGYVKDGDMFKDAVSKTKTQHGKWDPAYSNYTESQARSNRVAFPICVSSEDPYPGHGNVDKVTTVYSTWTLYPQYTVTAVSNNPEWGTVSVRSRTIVAAPKDGYCVLGYEVLEGTAEVTQTGNSFEVTAESDCTIQINFAPKTPAVVHFSCPAGVSCADLTGYVGDEITLPEPAGTPVADAHSYHFLGWAAAETEDTTVMPDFCKVNSVRVLDSEETTFYALYSYFVADNGIAEGQFLKVTDEPASWTGEYVLTYNGDVALDASGSNKSSAIGSTAAAVDLQVFGCEKDEVSLSGVTNEIVYEMIPSENGTYNLKMKDLNLYLAMAADTDSLTTYSSANTNKTRWTLTFASGGPVITNAQYSSRTLKYNESAGLFRCYTSGQKSLTLYKKADGQTWYATELKNKTVCETHSFGEWMVDLAPTCTEKGNRYHICTVCGERENETLEPLGHDYVAVVTAPTCTEGGFTTYTCSRCGEAETEAVDPLGHAWGEWREDPDAAPHSSCIRVDEYRECTRCGEKEYRSVAGEGHKPAAAVRENEILPTCTGSGSYDLAVYCENCGMELSREHVNSEALGHEWDQGVITTKPTVLETGILTYTCTRCGETRTEILDKLEHECPCAAFTDMPELGTVEHDAIDWAFTHDPQITTGTSATTFGPAKTVTRGQAVTFLWRAAGEPEPATTEHNFDDVKESAYYYKAMLWAVEKGITTGTSATRFSPNKTCTIEQILTFIYRFMEEPEVKTTENPWTDVNGDGFSFKAIMWAVENGIAAPRSETEFGRKDDCTRAAIVTFLYRIMTGNGLVK